MTLSALLTPGPAPGPFAPWGGVKPSNLDSGMQVTALSTPAMFVQVASGTCYVPATISTNSGYICHNSGARQCVIAAANPSNPRIDIVVAHVYDAVDDSGTLNTWALEVVTGTPAGSPVAPAAPTNSIVLARVAVAANASNIVNGNITDVRDWEVSLGGILPANSLADIPAGYTGHYVHDRSTGRLVHNPAAGPAQPKILPAAPVMATSPNPVNEGGTGEATLITLTFTADGATDWEAYIKAAAISANSSSAPYRVWFRMYLDNVIFDSQITAVATADNNFYGAVAYSSYMAAALGNRPGAGSHTLKVTFQTTAAGFGCTVQADSSKLIILRAKPVCL
jgi:hypothetical protein